MLRPVVCCAATSAAITSGEKAGWSHTAMRAASRLRENSCNVAMPARTDDAMPSAHAGFSLMSTGWRASRGRIFSAWAPSTTTTGHAADASAAAGNDLQNQNPLDLAHQILHDLDALSVVYRLVTGNADEIVEQHPEKAALRRRAYFHELDRKRSPPRVIPTDVTA